MPSNNPVAVEFRRIKPSLALVFLGIDDFYQIRTNLKSRGLDRNLEVWSTSDSLGGFRSHAARLFEEIERRNLPYVVSGDADMQAEAREWMMRTDAALVNVGKVPRRREARVRRHRRRS